MTSGTSHNHSPSLITQPETQNSEATNSVEENNDDGDSEDRDDSIQMHANPDGGK